MPRNLKIKRETIKGVKVITLPEIRMGEVMFCGEGAKQAKILKNLALDASSRNLSPMFMATDLAAKDQPDITVIRCGKCQQGTLELLTEKELTKLRGNNPDDIIPDRIYGCDECKYWVSASEVE